MFDKQTNTQLTNLDHIVVIKIVSNGSEVVDTPLKSEELDKQITEDAPRDDVLVRSEVSRVSPGV